MRSCIVFWSGFLALALGGTACSINPDYSGVSFACRDEGQACPEGYECVDEVCRPAGEPGLDADLGSSGDAAPVADASPPDAALVDEAEVCDQLFSEAPGYQLCEAEGDRCSFNVETAGGTCAQACSALGSVCLAAYDNDEGALCTPVGEDTCDTQRQTEICVCAIPDRA